MIMVHRIPSSVIIILFMVVGIILSSFASPILVFGGVAAFCAGMMLLGAPIWLFLFLVGWSMVAILIDTMFNSTLLRRIDDVQILLMLVLFMGKFALRRMPRIPLLKGYVFLLGIIGFSMVINGSPPKAMALFIMAYVSPYLIFCLLHSIDNKGMPDKMLKLILGVYGFGLIVNMGWFLRINPIYNKHLGTVDFAKGTMGVCSSWAYFSILVFFIVLSIYRHSNSSLKKGWCLVFLAVVLVQFFLTYTNHAYFIFAMMVPVYAVITNQRLRGYVALGLLVAIVGMTLSSIGSSDRFARMQGVQGFVLLDAQHLKKRWEQFLEQPKYDVFQKVVVHGVDDGFLQYLVGHGPGSGISTVARTHPSPYTFKIVGEYYLTHSGQESMVGLSITQSPWSGVTGLWSEVGLIGTVIFYVLPVWVMWAVFKRLRNGYYPKSSISIIIAEGFIIYGCIFYIINLLSDYWSVDYFTFLLWAMAGVALRWPLEREQEDEKKALELEQGEGA